MANKICEICKDKPATIPDRERMGRPINRICQSCHVALLKEDLKLIIEPQDEWCDDCHSYTHRAGNPCGA